MSKYRTGDRIELVRTTDPYTELRPGATGTVYTVVPASGFLPETIEIRWDSGSQLAMIPASGDEIRYLMRAVPADEPLTAEPLGIDYQPAQEDLWPPDEYDDDE